MSQTSEQFVVFTVDGNSYGIPIHEVSEIIRIRAVNWMPNSHKEFLGMIKLREKVIPVVSLYKIFSDEDVKKELDFKTRVIIIQNSGMEVGVVVDEVDRVMFLPLQHVSPPPHLSRNEWVSGVYHENEKIIILLNLNSLLAHMDHEHASHDDKLSITN